MSKESGVLRSELPLWFGAATAGIFAISGKEWLSDLSNPLWYGFLFAWLFAIMMPSLHIRSQIGGVRAENPRSVRRHFQS